MDEEAVVRQLAAAFAVPKPPTTSDRGLHYMSQRVQDRVAAYMREWTWATPIHSAFDVILSGSIPTADLPAHAEFEDLDLQEAVAGLSSLDYDPGTDPTVKGILSQQQFLKAGRLHYKPLLMAIANIDADGTWVVRNVAVHAIHAVEYFGPATAHSTEEMLARLARKLLHIDLPAFLEDQRLRSALDIGKSLLETIAGLTRYPVVPLMKDVYDVRVSGIQGDSSSSAGLASGDVLTERFGVQLDRQGNLLPLPLQSAAQQRLLHLLPSANVVRQCDGEWRKLHQATCTMADPRYNDLTRRAMLTNQEMLESTLKQALSTPLARKATVHSITFNGQVLASALMTTSGKHGRLVLGMGFHASITNLLATDTVSSAFVQACRASLAILLEHVARLEPDGYKIMSTKQRGSPAAFLGMVCGLPNTVGQTLVGQPRGWSATIRYRKDHMKAIDTVTLTPVGPNKAAGTVVLRSTKPMPKIRSPQAKRART